MKLKSRCEAKLPDIAYGDCEFFCRGYVASDLETLQMLLSMQSLSVSCYWYDRPLSGRQFLGQAKLFLINIRDAFPELSVLTVVRDPKESTGVVKRDFSNFDQEVGQVVRGALQGRPLGLVNRHAAI